MSYSDIEHFSNIVSGCEALTNGNGNSPDGVYALTVLKLHANDAGLYAGQEGFVENIKAAAGNIGEWIKKLISAIKQWLTGVRKETKEVEEIIKKTKVAKTKVPAEKKDKLIEKSETLVKKVSPKAQAIISKLEEISKQLEGIDGLDYKPNFGPAISAFKEAAGSDNIEDGLVSYMDGVKALEKEIDIITNSLNKVSGTDEERRKVGSAVGSKISTLAGIVEQIKNMVSTAAKSLLEGLETLS